MGVKMIPYDTRRRIVDACGRRGHAAEVADMFGVSKREVYRLARRMRLAGDVAPDTGRCGRKPKMTEEQLERVREALVETPDITLGVLVEKPGVPVGESTLGGIVRKMGFRLKKKVMHASEQERPRRPGRRADWDAAMDRLCREYFDNLVFVDESGTNINMRRRYGRAAGGCRVVAPSPVNTPATTTVISGMTPRGSLGMATWQGGTTKVRLADRAENVLIPSLKPGSVVVMDNLAAHHSKEVTRLFDDAKITVLYTPPVLPTRIPSNTCGPS